jgi:hypothetical protein
MTLSRSRQAARDELRVHLAAWGRTLAYSEGDEPRLSHGQIVAAGAALRLKMDQTVRHEGQQGRTTAFNPEPWLGWQRRKHARK